MHRLAMKWRLVALLAPVAAFLVLILAGSANTPGTSAVTSPVSGVTCTEFYLDIAPHDGVGEDITGDTIVDEDDISAIAISRTEPDGGGDFLLTSVLYIGPDTPADSETLVPNEAPSKSCSDARTDAGAGAEFATHNPRQEFSNQFGSRPGHFPTSLSGKDLTTQTCGFSDALGTWIRQDSTVTLSGTGPTSINDVDAVLLLATDAPNEASEAGFHDANENVAEDPNDCGGGFPYTTIGDSYGRDARTDNTTEAQNVALSIAADPSGTSGPDTADSLQDDYDGDGCTDWDELDNLFTFSFADPDSDGAGANTHPQRGMDPFNPYDCDANLNGNFSLLVTAAKSDSANACTLAQVAGGTCVGDGAYFHCLGDSDHTKSGGSQPVTWDLACYSDSPLSVVNDGYTGGDDTCPPASAEFCGNGLAGPSPPDGSVPYTLYASPQSGQWPIPATGTYTTSTGILDIGGCFAGLGGDAFGPNVFADGFIDLRTGAGEMDLFGKIQDEADCQNGSPFPSQSPVLNILDAEINFAEIGSKADAHDSDFDGCSDTEELGPSSATGGERDPFNEGDWFDPNGDGTVDLFNDILPPDGVAAKFGATAAGGPPYERTHDRASAVPNAGVHNITPPNGTIDLFDDIFGVAFQFGHTC